MPFSKAAGSSATEASPWGTLQGDERLRTKHGKRRVSARQGRAGEKVTFSASCLAILGEAE